MNHESERDALHEMNPTTRFTDRAADYVKYRPDYPAAAIDAILRGGSDVGGRVAADVGAGTGISARALADRGFHVIAIEPNTAMRAVAAPHPRVEWRGGEAEATGLPAGSADLVLCAQAFHWFRARDALAEFARILRPRGRLALMWNKRDRRDALTRGYTAAIRAVHGESPAERAEFDPTVVARDGWFTPPRLEKFAHRQSLDHEGLIGRALSASYVPREGDGFATLTRLLDQLWERHRDANGRVTLCYVTAVYLAEKA